MKCHRFIGASGLVCRAFQGESPRSVEAIQQHVKIDQASVRAPPGRDTAHAVIIQLLPELQPASQVVARPDIVTWINIESSESPQQRVFGAPTADTL
jgi:hypothetical protein